MRGAQLADWLRVHDANGGGVVVPLLADRRAAPGVVKADDGVHARGLDVAPRARQLPVPPTGAQ